jgi:anionic cell wall polymer biosynthesis LytR-Cps2A-Psr (LCP) family protein
MKNQTHWTKKKLFFLIIEIWLGVFILSVLSVVVALGVFYNTWWYRFKLHAKLTDRTAIELVRTGLNTPVTQENGRKNILLLGTDALANREGDPVLTDTMILFSLNLTNGTLTAISLPRDLWSVEYKTKINSLYEYGKDRYPDEPERFPTEVITQMTNVPVHHTIVLSLE